MSLYIKPPGGKMALSSLYEDARTRLLFLCQLHQRWGDDNQVNRLLLDHSLLANNSDCLIEGSSKDRTAHYILKLASLTNEQFKIFLTEAETHLLAFRLRCGGESALENIFSEVLRHTSFALKHMNLTPSYRELILEIEEISRVIVNSGMIKCREAKLCYHSVKVPWTLVEELVRTRSVLLVAGRAEVRCQQVVQLLCCFFRATFDLGLQQLSVFGVQESVFQDARLGQVIKSLHRLYRKQQVGRFTCSSHCLRHEDIENQVSYFPLCMQELHKILQSRNRLRHHARFRYTLFLKDIGLPLTENMTFWEKYYTKPHSSTAGGCHHAWDGRDRSRYTYGIRHLYGMEGGKKNYTSHSCSSLQALQPQPQETGGCPFNSYNPEQLAPLLQPLLAANTQSSQMIAKEISAGRPKAACKVLMAFTLNMRRKLEVENRKNQIHSSVTQVKAPEGETSKKKCCSFDVEMDAKRCEKNNNIKPADCTEPVTLVTPATQWKKQRLNCFESSAMQHSPNPDSHKPSVNPVQGAEGCSSTKNSSKMMCDIEDIKSELSECVFVRPSQYYLTVVSD